MTRLPSPRRMTDREPLERCANGCDAPPKPPSLVICGECMDKITAKLETMIADLDRRNAARKRARKGER